MMKAYKLHLNFSTEIGFPDFSCEFLQPSNEMAENYARRVLAMMTRHIPIINGGVLCNNTDEHLVEYLVKRYPPVIEINGARVIFDNDSTEFFAND